MDGLASFHVVALGVWLGVVWVETIFELGAASGRLDPRAVARLHAYTDRFAEAPLLALVVISGALLWRRTGYSGALAPKIAAGLGAVLVNLACVALVERRAKRTELDHTSGRAVMATALFGFPLAGIALFLGGQRAGWW